MHSDHDNFSLGLVLGLICGAVLGLLFAPKSGLETRKDIADLTSRVPDDLSDKLEDTKEACTSLIDRTRINIEKQINKITESIRAGKIAAAKKREEMEEGYSYN